MKARRRGGPPSTCAVWTANPFAGHDGIEDAQPRQGDTGCPLREVSKQAGGLSGVLVVRQGVAHCQNSFCPKEYSER
jgi:hypothetical protein